MGELFQPIHLLMAFGFLTLGLMPGWVSGYRRANHYVLIALLTLVGCADFSAHGGAVWAIALVWACYDKPREKPASQ